MMNFKREPPTRRRFKEQLISELKKTDAPVHGAHPVNESRLLMRAFCDAFPLFVRVFVLRRKGNSKKESR